MYFARWVAGRKHSSVFGPLGVEPYLRVGIARGPVMVQDIHFDLLGDTVILASRLESANRVYGSHILVNAKVRDRLSKPNTLRELDTIRVVGRDKPVVVFADDPILARQGGAFTSEHDIQETEIEGRIIQGYREGLAAYRKGSLQEAIQHFEVAASLGDGASETMLARLHEIVATDPEEWLRTWDGVWTLQSK